MTFEFSLFADNRCAIVLNVDNLIGPWTDVKFISASLIYSIIKFFTWDRRVCLLEDLDFDCLVLAFG